MNIEWYNTTNPILNNKNESTLLLIINNPETINETVNSKSFEIFKNNEADEEDKDSLNVQVSLRNISNSKNMEINMKLLGNNADNFTKQRYFKLHSFIEIFDFSTQKFKEVKKISPIKDKYINLILNYKGKIILKFDFTAEISPIIAHKKYNLPTGIFNTSSSCYLNTIIQVLRSIGFINNIIKYNYDSLSDNCKDKEFKGNNQFFIEYEYLLYKMQVGEQISSPDKFYNTIPAYEPGIQHDIHEFFLIILDIIKEMDSNKELYSNLMIEIEYEIHKRANDIIISVNKEEFIILSMDIISKSNEVHLEDCIHNYFVEETIDEYDYQGESCSIYKKGKIIKPPKLLFLHLKRFIYNKEKGSFEKNNTKVLFDENIEVEFFNKKKYILHGIIIHEGSFSSGHYYCYVKYKVDKKEYWVKCNDRQVEVTDNYFEIFEMSFGGITNMFDLSYNKKEGKFNINKKQKESKRSAYMLIYKENTEEFNKEVDKIINFQEPEEYLNERIGLIKEQLNGTENEEIDIIIENNSKSSNNSNIIIKNKEKKNHKKKYINSKSDNSSQMAINPREMYNNFQRNITNKFPSDFETNSLSKIKDCLVETSNHKMNETVPQIINHRKTMSSSKSFRTIRIHLYLQFNSKNIEQTSEIELNKNEAYGNIIQEKILTLMKLTSSNYLFFLSSSYGLLIKIISKEDKLFDVIFDEVNKEKVFISVYKCNDKKANQLLKNTRIIEDDADDDEICKDTNDGIIYIITYLVIDKPYTVFPIIHKYKLSELNGENLKYLSNFKSFISKITNYHNIYSYKLIDSESKNIFHLSINELDAIELKTDFDISIHITKVLKNKEMTQMINVLCYTTVTKSITN